jgi:hypothetical protein
MRVTIRIAYARDPEPVKRVMKSRGAGDGIRTRDILLGRYRAVMRVT